MAECYLRSSGGVGGSRLAGGAWRLSLLVDGRLPFLGGTIISTLTAFKWEASLWQVILTFIIVYVVVLERLS